MAATLTSTGVTFSDGTSLATAAPANTDVGGLITAYATPSTTANYTTNVNYVYYRYDTGATIAGSSLAYNVITGTAYSPTNSQGGYNFGCFGGNELFPSWNSTLRRDAGGGRQNLTFLGSGSSWASLPSAPVITWSSPPGSYRNVVPCFYANQYYAYKVTGTTAYWQRGMWQRYA